MTRPSTEYMCMWLCWHCIKEKERTKKSVSPFISTSETKEEKKICFVLSSYKKHTPFVCCCACLSTSSVQAHYIHTHTDLIVFYHHHHHHHHTTSNNDKTKERMEGQRQRERETAKKKNEKRERETERIKRMLLQHCPLFEIIRLCCII